MRNLLCAFAVSVWAAAPVLADEFKVVTTFTVIADMARNVAGPHATVVSVAKPGGGARFTAMNPRHVIWWRHRMRT